MKKGKLLIILSVIAVLTISFTVYAAAADTQTAKTIRSFFGVDTSKLTEQQKTDLNSSIDKMTALQKDTAQKMADIQKEAVNKMVANGSMTKVQGDAAIKKIDDQLKKASEDGFGKGFGMGKGDIKFSGMDGLDISKLTDTQKADLKDTFNKMVVLQKATVNKMIANGTLTKEQGDSSIKRIDEMVQDYDTNGYSKCMGMLIGGPGFWGIGGFDFAKLNDQQKADLKDAFTNMAALEKEVINKMISNGAMTKDQGDAAVKRIDDELNNFGTNGFNMGSGMKRGGFGEHGRMDKSNNTNSQTSTK